MGTATGLINLSFELVGNYLIFRGTDLVALAQSGFTFDASRFDENYRALEEF